MAWGEQARYFYVLLYLDGENVAAVNNKLGAHARGGGGCVGTQIKDKTLTSRCTTARRSVMAAKVRGANTHSLKCWATVRTTSSNQQMLDYDVAARTIAAA